MAQLRVWRFKKTGKYYDTIYIEFDDAQVKVVGATLDAFEAIKDAQAKDSQFIYVFTGKGLDTGFPKIFDIDRKNAIDLLSQ